MYLIPDVFLPTVYEKYWLDLFVTEILEICSIKIFIWYSKYEIRDFQEIGYVKELNREEVKHKVTMTNVYKNWTSLSLF